MTGLVTPCMVKSPRMSPLCGPVCFTLLTLHVKLPSPLSNEAKQTRWVVTAEPLKRREFNLMFSQGAEAVSGISQTVAINIEVEATRAL